MSGNSQHNGQSPRTEDEETSEQSQNQSTAQTQTRGSAQDPHAVPTDQPAHLQGRAVFISQTVGDEEQVSVTSLTAPHRVVTISPNTSGAM